MENKKIIGGLKLDKKELKFEILNDLGTISESTKGWSKKLTRIIWNEDEPKYDIRAWDSEFKKNGYQIHYKIINASEYGVPQNRERLILVGFRNDLLLSECFFDLLMYSYHYL